MDILNQIREHIFKTAFLKGLLVGEKVEEIELPSDIAQSDIIQNIADRIILDFKQLRPVTDIKDLEKELLFAFGYMFDNGIEISYFSRLLRDTEIKYNFNDLMNGISGDTFPVYIQEQVNPMIAVLAEIYNSTFIFILERKTDLAKNNIATKELMKLLLVEAAFLGAKFCLRIQLIYDN